MNELLSVLRRDAEDRLLHVEQIPARPGRTGQWPAWADAELVAGYRRLGVTEPWQHQVEAAESVWAGRHTVLATATGSGKSLAAWLPAISAVREGAEAAAGPEAGRITGYSRRPTTLYLSPTKALAADQLVGLERLQAAAALRGVRPATCDGDTPMEERQWVRDHADIVLTNPDFLHFSLLAGHRRWQRLLRGLRYVVVDECHAYRGVLGAHVALVLRRLARVAEHYGGRPTFVLASATTGEPAETAARLIGVPVDQVHAVVQDTAPQGRRTIALWQPPVSARWPGQGVDLPDDASAEEAAAGPRRSATTEAAELVAAECVVEAETKDHQNWQLIGRVAEAMKGDEAKAFHAHVTNTPLLDDDGFVEDDLSLHWRNATYRNNYASDMDENRLIVGYTFHL